jgi:hypothetical protein
VLQLKICFKSYSVMLGFLLTVLHQIAGLRKDNVTGSSLVARVRIVENRSIDILFYFYSIRRVLTNFLPNADRCFSIMLSI